MQPPIDIKEKCKEMLNSTNNQAPKVTKTGTTIAGIIFKDGVILGADTRATEGSIVAVKNCNKIHFIAKNILCCGAGTAADADYITTMVSKHIKTHLLTVNETIAPVEMIKTRLKRYLYQYQGHVSAALIVGGVDKKGPQLFSIAPHGSSDSVPFVTMGSGSLAALSIFEARYKENMELEEAKTLVRDAVAAGVFNDLGSGSNIDLCIITKDSTQHLRPYDVANIKGIRQGKYNCPKGYTPVLKRTRLPVEIVSRTTQRIEPMEE